MMSKIDILVFSEPNGRWVCRSFAARIDSEGNRWNASRSRELQGIRAAADIAGAYEH
jgi:hypothetical protein